MMLMQWFNELVPRERLLVGGGGALALMMTGYLALWQPLSTHHQQLNSAVASRQKLLDWMQESAAEAKQLQPQAGQQTATDPRTRISQLARSHKLQISRMQNGRDGELQVWLDSAEFNALLRLIGQLSREGITQSQLSVQALAEPGVVKARLVLAGR